MLPLAQLVPDPTVEAVRQAAHAAGLPAWAGVILSVAALVALELWRRERRGADTLLEAVEAGTDGCEECRACTYAVARRRPLPRRLRPRVEELGQPQPPIPPPGGASP